MRTQIVGALGLALVVGGARLGVAQAALTGGRAEMIAQLDDAAAKIEQLAGAIPQEKYAWRPAPGVRSVSEVLNHVAGGNYFVLTFAGVPAPAGEAETTDRAVIVARLKKSFDHVRAAIRALPDAELDKPATMFGQQTTKRNVYFTTVSHAHEHLGQLIAYARMNGVTPPWSAGQGQ